LVSRDVRTMTEILHEDFVYTGSSGERLDRTAYLARLVTAGDVKWLGQDLDEIDVRFFGDTAVLTARAHDRAIFGDETLDARVRQTFVFVKTGRGWRCVSGHASPIEPR
jgi:ketosteroid isomerase-like protein